MKKVILIIVIIAVASLSMAQELKFNKEIGFYEYANVKEHSNPDVKNMLITQMKRLNINEINDSGNEINGFGFFTHMIGTGQVVEFYYKVRIIFKDGRYKLIINNFELQDYKQRTRLEDLKYMKKKWVSTVNDKLPAIVKQLENFDSQNW